MDLNMNDLRAKSLNFFNLNAEADLTFTYIDEDGDVITLGDDNDLRDAAIVQHLNPLRINVLSKASKAEASGTKSQSGSSSSTRSPPVQVKPPLHISAGVEDAFKSVPEPFRNALLKLSNDLVSKAASSAPVLTELVEYYSKLGALIPNQEGATSSTPVNSSGCPVDLNVNEGFEACIDPVKSPKLKPKSSSVDKVPADDSKDYDGENSASGLRPSIPGNTPVDLNLKLPREDTPISGGSSVTVPVDYGNSAAAVSSFPPNVNHLIDLNPYHCQDTGITKQSVMTFALSGENNKQSPNSWEPSASQVGLDFHNRCSINSVPPTGPDASDIAPAWFHTSGYASKNSSGHIDSMLRTFHRGIQCDGCGMIPIMGPRFKSKV